MTAAAAALGAKLTRTSRGCWIGLPFSSSRGAASSGTRGARVERARVASAAAGAMPSAASLSCRSLRLACKAGFRGSQSWSRMTQE